MMGYSPTDTIDPTIPLCSPYTHTKLPCSAAIKAFVQRCRYYPLSAPLVKLLTIEGPKTKANVANYQGCSIVPSELTATPALGVRDDARFSAGLFIRRYADIRGPRASWWSSSPKHDKPSAMYRSDLWQLLFTSLAIACQRDPQPRLRQPHEQ